MTQIDVLAQVVKALDDAGIPHMVVGSFASTFHGDPRMTRDVDVVIDPTPRSIEVLIGELDRPLLHIRLRGAVRVVAQHLDRDGLHLKH